MTTRLLLVRHGETAANAGGRTQGRLDLPLTDRGQRQAAAVAAMLKPFSPGALFASPAQRARQTADAIAAALALEVLTDERLAELDHGELDGLTGEELRTHHAAFVQRWRDEDPSELRMPGGESLADAQRRMLAATEAIANAHAAQTVVIASHNLALKTLVCHALDVPLASFRSFQLDLASLTVVDRDEQGQFVVVTLNERCHLLDEGAPP